MTEQQGPGETSLSNTVPTVQDVKALPDEQKKALVQILPTEEKMALATAAMQNLPAEKQEEVRRNTLGPPSSDMADKIWMNIVRTLIGDILISLVRGLFRIRGKGRSCDSACDLDGCSGLPRGDNPTPAHDARKRDMIDK